MNETALRQALISHSSDELRHCRMFAALSKNLDGSGDASNQDAPDHNWILEEDRRFVEGYNGDVVEFVCDLFAGEVRTHSFLTGYLDALFKQQIGL